METRADRQPSGETWAPAAASYPRWILLDAAFEGGDDPDARTVAHARTSKGRPITLSLVLAAPPAVSGLRLHCHGLPEGLNIRSHVIAAHGDSVLVNIRTRRDGWDDNDVFAYDYFIYCAGDAAAEPSRPPSLSLLPPVYHTEQEEGQPKVVRSFDENGTALLRRGGHDEVIVVELSDVDIFENREESSGPVEGELWVLRSSSGDCQWELKRLPVFIHDEGKRQEVSSGWNTDGVMPVGDRFMLWVDYFRGIIYCDPWEETPELRYVSLPVMQRSLDRSAGSSYRSLCATNGRRAVRFLEVFPHCCCNNRGETSCAVSCYAFTITTWALRMDDMTTWDKVGVIDCGELWSIPGYHGVLPGIKPQYPTLSLDDPDVLCFMVSKTKYDVGIDGDLGKWMVELDTRCMELRSIFYYGSKFDFFPPFFASVISQYFDASSNSCIPVR